MTIETWKPVTGYSGYYEVSNLGNVKTLARTIIKRGHTVNLQTRLLGINTNKDGYLRVGFHDKTMPMIHRLVCEAFNGPAPEGKTMVLHWNDIKTDNRVENLRWGDAIDNAADYRRNCLNRQQPMGNRKLTEDQVKAIYRDDRSAVAIAREYGVSDTTVHNIRYGRNWRKTTNSL